MTSSSQKGRTQQRATAIALRALDTLCLKNPERSALGVMLGYGLSGLANFLTPALTYHHFQVGTVDRLACVALGVVMVHLPFLLWSVRHKPLVSDELEGLIQLIEITNIGEQEKRQAYRRLINKCIEEFQLAANSRNLESVIAEANREAKNASGHIDIRLSE